MAREITKAEMLQLYEEGMTEHEIFAGDRVLAHSYKNAADKPKGFEVVYCLV